MKLVIEAIFEADFEDSSYGYRPCRSAGDAVKSIKEKLQNGKAEVFDADLSAYFDTIPHKELMFLVAQRISDKNVLHLIKMWLKAPIFENNRYSGGKKNKFGTPQGGVLSPLLANIYLHLLDKAVSRLNGIFKRYGIEIVRYADDFVLMGRHIPKRVLNYLNNLLSKLKLKLNMEKSRMVHAFKEPFDFLGFTFRYDNDQYGRNLKYWNVVPSDKSLNKVRENLRSYLKKNGHKPPQTVARDLKCYIAWLD